MERRFSFQCEYCGQTSEAILSDAAGAAIECPHCRRSVDTSALREKMKETSTRSAFPVAKRVIDAPPVPEKNAGYGDRADLTGTEQRGEGGRVLVRSHLHRGASKRLDVSRTICVDWFRRGDKEEEISEDVFLASKELSDDEFLSRLNSKPSVDRGVIPAVPPPVYTERVSRWELVNWTKLGIWSGVFLVLTTLAALTLYGVLYLTRPDVAAASLKAPDPVEVSGVVAYRTRSGKIEGDDGAFVFLFPKDAKFEKPLVYYGAETSKQLPLKFDDFLAELSANGGYFERAGFDGFFMFEAVVPGEYRVLVVSFDLEGELDADDENDLKEIEKYLFKPEGMLRRSKYLWKTATIDDKNVELEYDLGKEVR